MSGLGLALVAGFQSVGSFVQEVLRPPSNFTFTYSDPFGGLGDVQMTWEPPTSGPSPDGYILNFSSGSTGAIQFVLTNLDFAQSVAIPSSEAWSAMIESTKDGFANSEQVSIGGTTPLS